METKVSLARNERDKLILKRYYELLNGGPRRSGVSRKLAGEFGLSKERVCEIIKQMRN